MWLRCGGGIYFKKIELRLCALKQLDGESPQRHWSHGRNRQWYVFKKMALGDLQCTSAVFFVRAGKSTAAKHLSSKGAISIDCDVLGHNAYPPGSAPFQRLVEIFGDDIVNPDGSMNRRALGAKVFGSPSEMKKLTDVVWPVIKDMARVEIEVCFTVLFYVLRIEVFYISWPLSALAWLRQKHLASSPTAVIIVEAAVLLEASWQDLVQQVWVVVTPPDLTVQRLLARNPQLTPADAADRLKSQMSNDERVRHAHVVIENIDRDTMIAALDKAWMELTV